MVVNVFEWPKVVYSSQYENKDVRILQLDNSGGVFVNANGSITSQPSIIFSTPIKVLAWDWMVRLKETAIGNEFDSDVSRYIKPLFAFRGDQSNTDFVSGNVVSQNPTVFKLLPFSRDSVNNIEVSIIDNINNYPELSAFDPSTGSLECNMYIEIICML